MAEFVTTVLLAVLLMVLAVLVYRSGKRNFLNRSFSLCLFFLAAWLMCGFPHLLVSEPSSYFVTLEFRLAHCTGCLTIGVFFLFSLGFYTGKRPSMYTLWTTALLMAFLALSSLTDLIIKEVTYSDGRFIISNGPLIAIYNTYILAGGALAFLLLLLKRSKSTSTDRARATYILVGFSILFFSVIVLVIVIPLLVGHDITSNYAFFAVIFPAGFTAYAIMRHRLLDVRLAVRRTFAYMLTLFMFGVPLVLAYTLFRYLWKSSSNLEMVISICALSLAVGFSPTILRWSNKLASRLFFTGMYDDMELLNSVSSIFTSTANIREGLIKATTLICEKLNLQSLKVSIPDEATRGQGNWLIGSCWTEEGIKGCQEIEESSPFIFLLWETLLISEDSRSSFDREEDTRRALQEMQERNLAACIPVNGPAGKMGMLLVGNKLNRMSLDPLDLDFLVHFAERAGLFIEN